MTDEQCQYLLDSIQALRESLVDAMIGIQETLEVLCLAFPRDEK